MIWSDLIWANLIWSDLLYSALLCSTLLYSALLCSALLLSLYLSVYLSIYLSLLVAPKTHSICQCHDWWLPLILFFGDMKSAAKAYMICIENYSTYPIISNHVQSYRFISNHIHLFWVDTVFHGMSRFYRSQVSYSSLFSVWISLRLWISLIFPSPRLAGSF